MIFGAMANFKIPAPTTLSNIRPGQTVHERLGPSFPWLTPLVGIIVAVKEEERISALRGMCFRVFELINQFSFKKRSG